MDRVEPQLREVRDERQIDRHTIDRFLVAFGGVNDNRVEMVQGEDGDQRGFRGADVLGMPTDLQPGNFLVR